MSNLEKLKKTFSESLGIPEELVIDDLTYGLLKEWDSVAHMALVAEIEAGFDIMMDTDDIIDMSSFAKAKEMLQKYGIDFHS